MSRLLQQSATEQAERRPEAPALVMSGEQLTYAQLEAYTNRIARALRAAGCQRGDRVVLLMPKSIAAIAAILGVLKADGIYVPVDTSSPAPRLGRVIALSEPRCILATSAAVPLLQDLLRTDRVRAPIGIGWLDDRVAADLDVTPRFSAADINRQSPEPLACANTSGDAAYILFTSGSTGLPKGVVITHANVICFMDWATKYFGLGPLDRLSGHPPLHFDLSVFDIFGTFAAGAQLHPVPPKLDLLPNKLADFIRSAELTQWFSVPSVLTYLAKFDVVRFNDFPSLRRLLWCGEVLPTPVLRAQVRMPKHLGRGQSLEGIGLESRRRWRDSAEVAEARSHRDRTRMQTWRSGCLRVARATRRRRCHPRRLDRRLLPSAVRPNRSTGRVSRSPTRDATASLVRDH